MTPKPNQPFRTRLGQWFMNFGLNVQGYPSGKYNIVSVPESEGEMLIFTARQMRRTHWSVLEKMLKEFENKSTIKPVPKSS